MLKLNSIKAPPGSNPAPLRKGRGIGSGLGKTAGKGHKGQHARSGAPVHPSFEGGQMPIQRRSPKVGFRSHLKSNCLLINISELGSFKGQDVTLESLVPKNRAHRTRLKVVVFGTHKPSSFPKSISAHRFTPSVKQILEDNGVAVSVIHGVIAE